MNSSRYLYVYFNKQGVLTTQIPHGSGTIRQGDSFDLYVCFDQDMDLSNKVMYIRFKPPGEEWGINYDFTDGYLGVKQFKKLSHNEITYDLKDGVNYKIYKFHASVASAITHKYGNLEALISILQESSLSLSQISPNNYEDIGDVYANGLITIYVEKTYGKNLSDNLTHDQYVYLLSEIATLYKKVNSQYLNKFSEGESGQLNIVNENGRFEVTNENIIDDPVNNKLILNEKGLKFNNSVSGDDYDYNVSFVANEENGFEIVVSKSGINANDEDYVEKTIFTLLHNNAMLNGDKIAGYSYVQSESERIAQAKYESAISLINTINTRINTRIDKILDGADVDYDTFKELSDQIKKFMEDHEEFIDDINALKTKLFTDRYSTEVSWTLTNNADVTYAAENIKSIILNIPPTIGHGFYCGVNFKSGEQVPAISIVNNSDMDVEIIKNGRQVSTLIPQPGTTSRMFIDCDGMHIYITVQELIPDALY